MSLRRCGRRGRSSSPEHGARPVAWHGYAEPAKRGRDVGSSGVETVLVAGDGAAAEQGVDELSCGAVEQGLFGRLAVTLDEHS
jgi:hypothetical protein